MEKVLTKRALRKYDREFKLEAVRLSREQGRSVSGVARDLGISENVLYRWRGQLVQGGEAAFPGKVIRVASRRSYGGYTGNWPR